FISPDAMDITVIYTGTQYMDAMPGLNSPGTCEKAEVAIATSVAAAIKVLDKIVIASSSELTCTPTNRALAHRRLDRQRLEMPLHNRFDSREASLSSQ